MIPLTMTPFHGSLEMFLLPVQPIIKAWSMRYNNQSQVNLYIRRRDGIGRMNSPLCLNE